MCAGDAHQVIYLEDNDPAVAGLDDAAPAPVSQDAFDSFPGDVLTAYVAYRLIPGDQRHAGRASTTGASLPVLSVT